MKRIAIFSFSVCFLFAPPAFSQDTAPSPAACMVNNAPADLDTLSAAKEIMQKTGATDRMSTMVDTLMPLMLNSIKKSNPNLTDEAVAAFQSAFHDEMVKNIPQVLSQMACIYAHHYTAAELHELIAFYNSPLGQKMVSSSAAILNESMAVGAMWGQQMGTAAAQRVLESLRAKGVKI